MVTTFEWAEGRLKPLGSSESLTAASLTLPAGAYTTLRTYGADRLLRLSQLRKCQAQRHGRSLR